MTVTVGGRIGSAAGVCDAAGGKVLVASEVDGGVAGAGKATCGVIVVAGDGTIGGEVTEVVAGGNASFNGDVVAFSGEGASVAVFTLGK